MNFFGRGTCFSSPPYENVRRAPDTVNCHACKSSRFAVEKPDRGKVISRCKQTGDNGPIKSFNSFFASPTARRARISRNSIPVRTCFVAFPRVVDSTKLLLIPPFRRERFQGFAPSASASASFPSYAIGKLRNSKEPNFVKLRKTERAQSRSTTKLTVQMRANKYLQIYRETKPTRSEPNLAKEEKRRGERWIRTCRILTRC